MSEIAQELSLKHTKAQFTKLCAESCIHDSRICPILPFTCLQEKKSSVFFELLNRNSIERSVKTQPLQPWHHSLPPLPLAAHPIRSLLCPSLQNQKCCKDYLMHYEHSWNFGDIEMQGTTYPKFSLRDKWCYHLLNCCRGYTQMK